MTDRPDIQFRAQIEQDQIVLALLNGKRDGTFVDIGCGPPTLNSNTFLLESEYGWSGIAIDSVHQTDSRCGWVNRKATRHIVADAMTLDYATLFENHFGEREIDFLSLDLEPPSITHELLFSLPWQRWRPHVIAYEADAYRDPDAADREHEASAFLRSMGYSLRARLYPRLAHLLTQDVGCQDQIWMRSDTLLRQTRG